VIILIGTLVQVSYKNILQKHSSGFLLLRIWTTADNSPGDTMEIKVVTIFIPPLGSLKSHWFNSPTRTEVVAELIRCNPSPRTATERELINRAIKKAEDGDYTLDTIEVVDNRKPSFPPA
jgi:hypothetical protein